MFLTENWFISPITFHISFKVAYKYHTNITNHAYEINFDVNFRPSQYLYDIDYLKLLTENFVIIFDNSNISNIFRTGLFV